MGLFLRLFDVFDGSSYGILPEIEPSLAASILGILPGTNPQKPQKRPV
jgi:hypothetical protein